MKTLGILVLTLLSGLGVIWCLNNSYYYPCDHPVDYKLGVIDPRFNLTSSAAEADITQAADIWNQAWGKPVLKEDPQAKLIINFVYDERQQLSSQVQNMESGTNTDRTALDSKVAQFQAKLNDFAARVAALNSEIDSWNAKGGAPKDVYDSLISRQQALKTEENSLRTEAASLKISINNYNFQVDQLNNTVNTFNAVIAQKPESGLFDGQNQTISIYYVNSKDELIHTLAHELGHALNMDHVSDPQALMYAFQSKTITPTPEDDQALQKTCARISNAQIILDYYYQNFTRTQASK
ncbi:matrixin family metalloprotease [Patescibacteria group bacterium]|nr:matrixin family metalloprotease [Patescibacteria group bacterium]